MRALLPALLSAVALSGCQCINDDNFTQLKDAGFEEVDAGPPPPVFPLKAGDQLVYNVLGGRIAGTAACASGGCDRSLKATYNLKSVELNSGNRWEITSDVLYEGTSDVIEPQDIARLILENVAPFSSTSVATPTTTTDALFTTDEAPAPTMTANNFPFFQAALVVEGSAQVDSAVFDAAALEFADAFKALDPQADVETQSAAGKFSVYFADNEAPAMLHKLVVEIHPMGFVCGWDERLRSLESPDMPRSESSFAGVNDPPLAASFFQPLMIRDGKTYQCSCFSGVCRDSSTNTCLKPEDPSAAPGPCP